MVVTWQFCHKNWMLCCTPLPNMQQMHHFIPSNLQPNTPKPSSSILFVVVWDHTTLALPSLSISIEKQFVLQRETFNAKEFL
jgi:hypothetical protein